MQQQVPWIPQNLSTWKLADTIYTFSWIRHVINVGTYRKRSHFFTSNIDTSCMFFLLTDNLFFDLFFSQTPFPKALSICPRCWKWPAPNKWPVILILSPWRVQIESPSSKRPVVKMPDGGLNYWRCFQDVIKEMLRFRAVEHLQVYLSWDEVHHRNLHDLDICHVVVQVLELISKLLLWKRKESHHLRKNRQGLDGFRNLQETCL